jgi:3-oxoadipate enol-lactonase
MAGIRGLATFDRLDGLSQIGVPVLITAGAWDVLTPLSLAHEMQRRIPKAELVVFPQTGHMAPLERHAEFSGVLIRFLEQVLPG